MLDLRCRFEAVNDELAQMIGVIDPERESGKIGIPDREHLVLGRQPVDCGLGQLLGVSLLAFTWLSHHVKLAEIRR